MHIILHFRTLSFYKQKMSIFEISPKNLSICFDGRLFFLQVYDQKMMPQKNPLKNEQNLIIKEMLIASVPNQWFFWHSYDKRVYRSLIRDGNVFSAGTVYLCVWRSAGGLDLWGYHDGCSHFSRYPLRNVGIWSKHRQNQARGTVRGSKILSPFPLVSLIWYFWLNCMFIDVPILHSRKMLLARILLFLVFFVLSVLISLIWYYQFFFY